MKKCLKIFTFTLCCIVSALVFGACTDNTTTKVLVEKISVDKGSVTLVLDEDNLASSKQEIQISYEPANSTQVDVEFFQYDTSLIEITQKQNTGYTYIIKANDFEGTTKQTTIGIRMKGNVDVQTKCIVKVEKKSLAPLTTPQNLRYDSDNGVITWDKSTHTVDEGFDGYTLKINNEEIYCTQNSYELTETGTVFNVQVKTNSIVASKDSAFSSTYSFKILPNLTNLKHENGVVSWDSVEGASKYSYKVGVLGEQLLDKNTTCFPYTFSSQGTYTFKVQALGEDIINDDQTITHVFNSAISQIQVIKLSAPENFTFNKFFSWDTPSLTEQLPQGYEIVEIVGENENLVATVKDNQYELSDIAQGEHTFKIRAIGDNKTTITSDYSATKTITKLSAPKNLRVEDGVITWDKDINTTSYHLIFMGMFDGVMYDEDYYNTDKNINSYFYIDQPQTEGNKVTFVMGEKFSGQYNIKVASVGDANNTVDSNFTDALTVTKLNPPETTSFGLTNNVLSWNKVDGASAYNIELFFADDSVVTDTVFTNSYTLPQSIAQGEFSFRLTAVGDSTKNTLTSDKSAFGYSQALCTPTLFVQNGVLKWEMPRVNGKIQEFSSFVLTINGTETNMAKQTKFDFSGYDAGTYNVKIKAKGGNSSTSGTKFIIGTVDSAYSSILSVVKYSIPALKLEEGEVKVSSIDDIEQTQIKLSSENISSTQIKYTAKVVGTDATHITSELSSPLVVIKPQVVQNLKVENGVLSWDKLSDDYKGAYFELEINSVVDGNSNREVFDMGTNNSKDFSTSDYLAGTYSARVRIVGTTSNKDANVIQSSDYSASHRFYKLPQPELSATGALPAIQNSSLDVLPGTLTWDISTVGSVQAQGYTIKTIKNGTTYSYNVTADNYFTLPTEAGTYKIQIEAYGNTTDIIDSGFSDEIEFEKLSSATNFKIALDGELSWSSSYNTENSGLFALATFPINFRVLYVININGEYYSPYDVRNFTALDEDTFAQLNKVKSVNFNELRLFSLEQTDIVKFGSGTYTAKVLTLPLNFFVENAVGNTDWGYLTDLVSEYSNEIEFTKLESPLGFRVDRDYDNDYIISWTRSLNANVSGYELLIKEAGKEDSDGEIISLGNNTTYNFTQDYLQAKGLANGNYVAKVRCITSTSGYIASDYCDEITLNILDDLSLNIKNGKLSWAKQNGAVNYVFNFTKNGETITITLDKNITEYELTLANNSKFTAGDYTISAQVIGDSSSNYANQVNLSALQVKNYGTFTKLATPTNLRVVEGLINFDCENTPDSFNLYVKQGEKTQTVNIKTQKIYELNSSFGAGRYSLTAQAMGGTKYLNSEISNNITPSEVEKLASPTLYLKNGILNWNYIENANTYQLEISGASFKYEVKVPEGVTSFDVSGEITDINGTTFSLNKGEYSIKIKAIGTSKTYLNSNYSSNKTFTKLATPTNLKIEDGILTWDKIVANTDAPNGVALYIKPKASSSYETPIVLDRTQTSFDFAGTNYPAGEYSVYLQAIGDTKDNFTSGNVCGTPSEVIILEKLSVPTNAKVNYSSDMDVTGVYTFDALNKTEIENPKYLLKLNLTLGDISKELEITLDTNQYNVMKTIEGIELIAGAEIQFSVKYLGEDKFINSEYNAPLSIVIPETPQLNVVIDERDNFTGKLTWSEVGVGDTDTNYVLIYQYISLDVAKELGINQMSDITETIWENKKVDNKEINTSNLFAYVTQKGYYRFKVLSTLIIGEGENTTVIKSPAQDYSNVYNYCLFSGGIGTQDDPFVVDSAETFNFIRYNLTAHYKLPDTDSFVGIDFNGQTIYSIGSDEEAFTGSFNGNNKLLYNISISKVSKNSSIFDCLGQTGVIKNVIVQNINITNGSNVGGIVGRNLGTIYNVIVGAKLENGTYSYDGLSTVSPYSTSDQSASRVGGICGLNEGTVENCINYSIVAPRNDYEEVRSGGIAGENKGTITNCFNYNSIGGTSADKTAIFSNMSGGITGYNNTGVVNKSGNYGNVFAISRNINKVSQGAYAGGVVGYNEGGTLSGCFNNNSNRNYTDDQTISAQTQIYGLTTINSVVFVGGLVGDNSSSSTIENCYTLSNIQFNLSGTSSSSYVGAAVGNNRANTMSTGNGIRFYVFSASMTQNAGTNITSQSFKVYGCTQNNNELSTFKTYILSSFGVELN